MPAIRLSATIICLNEEKNIQRCLDSIHDIVDEIIIVDSGSTDRTEEICKSFAKVRYLNNEFKGYAEQKNYAIGFSTNDFILSLDADECLSPELKQSIEKIKLNSLSNIYEFNRLNSYCGNWIRHSGWYPDRKIRLFHKNRARWNGNALHEKIEFDKNETVVFLKGDLLHYTYHTIEEHIEELNKYTTLAARDAYSKNKSVSILKICIYPLFVFFKKYIFQLGFLDGYPGFLVCLSSAYYRYLKYAKLKELYKTQNL